MSESNTKSTRSMTAEQARQRVVDAAREVCEEQAEELESRMRKSIEEAALKHSEDSANKAVQRYLEDQGHQKVIKTDPGKRFTIHDTDLYQAEQGLITGGVGRCLMLAHRDNRRRPAEAIALDMYGEDHPVTKALQANDADSGGFLVEGDFSADVIELLRAKEVIEAAGPMRVPLSKGSLTLPKLTGAATGGWIGEGTDATVTEETFGQVTLTARKYAAIVPMSNDLLRYASVDADRIVRDDLVRVIRLAEDLAFIRGDGTAAQPKGLRNMQGAQTNAQSGTTLAAATNDTAENIQLLMDADVLIDRPHWFYAPRTWRFFASIRDGNGNLAFQPEISQRTLWGYPFSITTQIPTNLGGGTESEIYLVEMTDIIVGRAAGIEVMASDVASYTTGGNTVSTFQRDETAIRALSEVDINTRHGESIVIQTGVTLAA